MIWFTSDLHIDHKNKHGTGIIDYCKRPFSDIQEMWETIKKNWNKNVKVDDEIWVLGDFAFNNSAFGKQFLADQLNGTKRLILGNHDGDLRHNRGAFSIVLEQAQIRMGRRQFVLSHYPYRYSEDRYPDRAPIDNGLWLLCGHVHERWKIKNRMINVGQDQWNFTPIPQTKICEIADKLDKKNLPGLRIT